MPKSANILVVGRSRQNLNLLGAFLEREGWSTRKADSLDVLDGILISAPDISLALFDLAGFDSRIWSRCERLREAEVPFFIISPKACPDVRRESAVHGACGTLVKPLVAAEFVQLVRRLLGKSEGPKVCE